MLSWSESYKTFFDPKEQYALAKPLNLAATDRIKLEEGRFTMMSWSALVRQQ